MRSKNNKIYERQREREDAGRNVEKEADEAAVELGKFRKSLSIHIGNICASDVHSRARFKESTQFGAESMQWQKWCVMLCVTRQQPTHTECAKMLTTSVRFSNLTLHYRLPSVSNFCSQFVLLASSLTEQIVRNDKNATAIILLYYTLYARSRRPLIWIFFFHSSMTLSFSPQSSYIYICWLECNRRLAKQIYIYMKKAALKLILFDVSIILVTPSLRCKRSCYVPICLFYLHTAHESIARWVGPLIVSHCLLSLTHLTHLYIHIISKQSRMFWKFWTFSD